MMMKLKDKDIRLVTVDLDGTLLNSDKRVSDRTKNAIINASKKGIVIVPATGRHYTAVPQEVLAIPGIRYIMGMSGAAIYDNKEKCCIHKDEIPRLTAIELISRLQKYDILTDVLYGDAAYRNEEDFDFVDRLSIPDKMKEFVKNSRKPVKNVLEMVKNGTMDVSKLILNFLPDGTGGCLYRDEIIKMGEEYPFLTFLSGGLGNLEITMTTANKGEGLKKLAALLDIPVEKTMAVGDAGNDADMIKTAGFGVAMKNAEPEILKIADYITASNDDDGVAILLEEI